MKNDNVGLDRLKAKIRADETKGKENIVWNKRVLTDVLIKNHLKITLREAIVKEL